MHKALRSSSVKRLRRTRRDCSRCRSRQWRQPAPIQHGVGSIGIGNSFFFGRIPSRNAAGFLGKWISPVIGQSAFEEDHGEIDKRLSWQVSDAPRRIATMAVLGLGISPIAFKDQKSRQKKRQHTGFVYCLNGDFRRWFRHPDQTGRFTPMRFRVRCLRRLSWRSAHLRGRAPG